MGKVFTFFFTPSELHLQACAPQHPMAPHGTQRHEPSLWDAPIPPALWFTVSIAPRPPAMKAQVTGDRGKSGQQDITLTPLKAPSGATRTWGTTQRACPQRGISFLNF